MPSLEGALRAAIAAEFPDVRLLRITTIPDEHQEDDFLYLDVFVAGPTDSLVAAGFLELGWLAVMPAFGVLDLRDYCVMEIQNGHRVHLMRKRAEVALAPWTWRALASKVTAAR